MAKYRLYNAKDFLLYSSDDIPEAHARDICGYVVAEDGHWVLDFRNRNPDGNVDEVCGELARLRREGVDITAALARHGITAPGPVPPAATTAKLLRDLRRLKAELNNIIMVAEALRMQTGEAEETVA